VEAVAEKPKVSDQPTDELVKLYVAIRDQLAVDTKAYETRKASLKGKLEKLAGILLFRFKEAGVESSRTKFGTAFKEIVTSASVGDADTFFDFVFSSKGGREFLQARVSKEAVKQYIAEHGDLPPGINWYTEETIKVRRA